jgi:hypothetical protein
MPEGRWLEMDTDTMSSMIASIGCGGKKENSRFKDEEGFSETWDALVEDIEKIKKAHPGAQISVPSDF